MMPWSACNSHRKYLLCFTFNVNVFKNVQFPFLRITKQRFQFGLGKYQFILFIQIEIFVCLTVSQEDKIFFLQIENVL